MREIGSTRNPLLDRAARDVAPGMSYAECLVVAIAESRVLVLVFSESANQSDHVLREVERAVSKGIPILPFRIEEAIPTSSLEFFLSTPHWLDAITPPIERHMATLGDSIVALMEIESGNAHENLTLNETGDSDLTPVSSIAGSPVNPGTTAGRKRLMMAALLATLSILVVAVSYAVWKDSLTAGGSPQGSQSDERPIASESEVTSDDGEPMNLNVVTKERTEEKAKIPVPQSLFSVNDRFSVNEGAESFKANVLSNDDLPSNEALKTVLLQRPRYGQIEMENDGTFTYRHGGTEEANDTFTYKVTTTGRESNVANVSLDITPINDPPRALDDQHQVEFSGRIEVKVNGVLANDKDPENNKLTSTVSKKPANGIVSLYPDGSFVYVHDGSDVRRDAFEYRVEDGHGGSDTGRVTITVAAKKLTPKFAAVSESSGIKFGSVPKGWKDLGDAANKDEHTIEFAFDTHPNDDFNEVVFGDFVLVVDAEVTKQFRGFAATLIDNSNGKKLVVQASMVSPFSNGAGWYLSANGSEIDNNFTMPSGPHSFRLERTENLFTFNTDSNLKKSQTSVPYSFKGHQSDNFDAIRIKITRDVKITGIRIGQLKND